MKKAVYVVLSCMLFSATILAEPKPGPLMTDALPGDLATRRLQKIVQKQQLFDANQENLTEAQYSNQANELVAEYIDFVEKNPNLLEGLLLAGKFFREMGMERESITVFMKALELQPGLPVACQQLGNFCVEADKPVEALGYFIEASDNDPKVAIYAYEAAAVLTQFREFFLSKGIYTATTIDAAMEFYFKRAVDGEPSNRLYTVRYAEMFFDQYNPDWMQARACWEKVEATAKDQNEAQYAALRLAQIYLELQEDQQVRAALNKVHLPVFAEEKYRLLGLLESNFKKASLGA